MADCSSSGLPTRDSLEKMERQAEFITQVGTSRDENDLPVESVTNPDTGVTLPTMEAIDAVFQAEFDDIEQRGNDLIEQVETDVAVAISASGYNIIGDFSDAVKVEITNPNQVYSSKSIVGFEDGLYRYLGALPYTPTETEPNSNWASVALGELKSAALAVGTNYLNIMYDTDLTTPIVGYIFVLSSQQAYSVPSGAQGKTITSVINGVLTTNDSQTYALGSVNKSGVEFATIHDIDTLYSVGGKISGLLVGDSVVALDYATGNNAGLLFFTVVASGTGVADGGEYIDLPTLGLQLKQNLKRQLDVKSYGAVESLTIDSSVSFQNALNSRTSVHVTGGPYLVGSIDFNEGNKLIGDSMYSSVDNGAMIVPSNNTGYIFDLVKGCGLEGFLFYEPNQTYEMTSDYINESFNPTALPIKINTASYVNCKNITSIGFNKIVGQDDLGSSLDLSAGTFENFRGFALDVAFDIRRSLDVLKFKDIHFNLNSYRAFGKTSVDIWYYTKAALQARVFKFARVDDAHMSDIFAFGVKRLIDVVKDGYTGDNNSGGGLNMVNFGVDACSQLFASARSDSNFGYHMTNGWAVPIITPLDGSSQTSVLLTDDATANEVFLTNFSQFGNSSVTTIDPVRTALAEHVVELGVNTVYNRVITSNCQAIQTSGELLVNLNTNTYPTRNTFHGDDIILAQQEDFSIRDLDGKPALTIRDKKLLTHGINNNGLDTAEGISSGSFNVSQGSQPNVNAGVVTFGTFATYTKVGSVVSYSGQLIVPSLGAGQVTVYIAPPLAFDSGAGRGSGGVLGKQMGVYVEKTGSNISVSFTADSADTHQISFTGQYYLQ